MNDKELENLLRDYIDAAPERQHEFASPAFMPQSLLFTLIIAKTGSLKGAVTAIEEFKAREAK